MYKGKIHLVIVGLILVGLFSLCGCSDQGTRSKKSTMGQRAVSYRLKWLFNASTIGDLWARDKGLFAAKGLDVTIKEGGAEHDAIEDIELGRADFGVASADQVIRAVSRGADCLVIAQIFQENPLQWIFNASRVSFDPERPAESLARLTVGITYGGNDEAIFMALAGRLGLDPSRLHLYAITYDYTPFWRGEVDLWPCYRNTQGITLTEKMDRLGEKAGFLDPGRYGIRFVANSLITSRKFQKRHGQMVKLFRQCILEGWQQAIRPENLDEAVDILSRYEKGLSKRILMKQIKATSPLITAHGQHKVGFIDQEAWGQTEEIMFKQGLIKKRVDVKKLFLGMN